MKVLSSESGASDEKKCQRTNEISCNQLAREGISYVKLHNPGVRIRFETTIPDSTFILTNRVYLTRTIRELLYNAVKHSDRKHIQMRVVRRGYGPRSAKGGDAHDREAFHEGGRDIRGPRTRTAPVQTACRDIRRRPGTRHQLHERLSIHSGIAEIGSYSAFGVKSISQR